MFTDRKLTIFLRSAGRTLNYRVSLDGREQKQQTSEMLKQAFYIIILGLAVIGLAAQGMASPMSCSLVGKSEINNAGMPHCNDMDMENASPDSNGPKDCCGSDCAAMLQCSQASATFMANAALTYNIVVGTMSHVLFPIEEPAGLHRTPEIKPPITG